MCQRKKTGEIIAWPYLNGKTYLRWGRKAGHTESRTIPVLSERCCKERAGLVREKLFIHARREAKKKSIQKGKNSLGATEEIVGPIPPTRGEHERECETWAGMNHGGSATKKVQAQAMQSTLERGLGLPRMLNKGEGTSRPDRTSGGPLETKGITQKRKRDVFSTVLYNRKGNVVTPDGT